VPGGKTHNTPTDHLAGVAEGTFRMGRGHKGNAGKIPYWHFQP